MRCLPSGSLLRSCGVNNAKRMAVLVRGQLQEGTDDACVDCGDDHKIS